MTFIIIMSDGTNFDRGVHLSRFCDRESLVKAKLHSSHMPRSLDPSNNCIGLETCVSLLLLLYEIPIGVTLSCRPNVFFNVYQNVESVCHEFIPFISTLMYTFTLQKPRAFDNSYTVGVVSTVIRLYEHCERLCTVVPL